MQLLAATIIKMFTDKCINRGQGGWSSGIPSKYDALWEGCMLGAASFVCHQYIKK